MKQIVFIGNALIVAAVLGVYSLGIFQIDEEFYLYGLIGQFALGIIQLVTALVLSILVFRKQPSELTRLLKAYWGMVIVYALAGLTMYVGAIDIFEVDVLLPIVIGGIPMSIAMYFVYLTYRYSKS